MAPLFLDGPVEAPAMRDGFCKFMAAPGRKAEEDGGPQPHSGGKQEDVRHLEGVIAEVSHTI